MLEEHSSQKERRCGVFKYMLAYVRKVAKSAVGYFRALKAGTTHIGDGQSNVYDMQQYNKEIAPSLFQEVKRQNQDGASIDKNWIEEGIYVDSSTAGYRLPDEWVSPSGPKPPTHAAPVIRQ